MSLVVCLDCAGDVSDEAEVCIHCGKPLMEQPTDIVGGILMFAYAIYLIGSGLFVAFRCLGAFVYFADLRLLPSTQEVSVFLLWVISLSAGWTALKTAAKGPKVPRKLVVRERTKSEK